MQTSTYHNTNFLFFSGESPLGKCDFSEKIGLDTDHLGNVRVSYKKDVQNGGVTVLDENHYYPFGMRHRGVNSVKLNPDYKYSYNGKELQNELGLNMHDYGARNYDASLGRWIVVDPAAELMRRFSPYNYVFNNPLVFIDKDGMLPDDIVVKGANGSSVTVATDLIDTEVDVSSLGIDFGGEYTLSGDDVVITALDIVGVFDPSPISDGLSASLSAKKGDWLGATVSVIGFIPYVGDIAKGPKIAKGVKSIMKAIEAGKGVVKKAVQKTAKKASKEATEKATKVGSNATAKGKASNKLKPNKDANGDHTTFKRGDDGNIHKYETYEKTKTGHFNPKKRYDGGKPDGSPGAPHRNKKTGEAIPTPHVQGKGVDGGVRPARPDEIPKSN